MPLPKTTTKHLKYDFTREELAELSSNLATTVREKAHAEDEKKSVTSQYAAKINEKSALANRLASRITNGYDLKRRMKIIARKDTGEIVEEKPMTADELQLELPLEVFDAVNEELTNEPVNLDEEPMF